MWLSLQGSFSWQTAAADKGAKTVATEAGKAEIWTCLQHLQIRQPSSGNCPVCGAKLRLAGHQGTGPEVAQFQLPAIMGLQEMLATALRHNPEVRAARAKVLVAEGELDRARLETLRQIMAYRERWESLRNDLETALTERQHAETAEPAVRKRLVNALEKKINGLRSKLAEINAEAPLLLGASPDLARRADTSQSRDFIENTLLPKAQQHVNLLIIDYKAGNARMSEIVSWYRRMVELEGRLTESRHRKREILDEHAALLQQCRVMVEQRYRAGRAPQSELLEVDYAIAEIKLKRLEQTE